MPVHHGCMGIFFALYLSIMNRWYRAFLFFSRSQQIGILVLLVCIVLLLLGQWLFKYRPKQAADVPDSLFIKEAMAFKNSLKTFDASGNEYTDYRAKKEMIEVYLRPFDPNSADSATLVSLGFKSYVARNLVRYRAKGGQFRTPSDLKRLYGMTDQLFETLEPYISIDSMAFVTPSDLLLTDTILLLVELNAADTAMLKQLRGIGPVLAQRIVTYRGQLGGYERVEQLLEVYGITAELLASLSGQLSVCTDSIKPIRINRASIERLKGHPYIDFFQAKAIYEYRRQHRYLDSIEQLQGLEQLPTEWHQKMAPYLDFSIPQRP